MPSVIQCQMIPCKNAENERANQQSGQLRLARAALARQCWHGKIIGAQTLHQGTAANHVPGCNRFLSCAGGQTALLVGTAVCATAAAAC